MARGNRSRSRSTLFSMDKLRSFTVAWNIFFTLGDWNITAAVVLTLASNLVAIFLGLLEPAALVCQISYIKNITDFGSLSYLVYCFMAVFAIFFYFADVGLFLNQILLLWLHSVVFFLYAYPLGESWLGCFPNIHRPRSHYSSEIYVHFEHTIQPDQCPSKMNNCYRSFFDRFMIVLMISVIVGIFHTVIYGSRAWKRLPRIPRLPNFASSDSLFGSMPDPKSATPPTSTTVSETDESSNRVSSDPGPSSQQGSRMTNPRRDYMQRGQSTSSASDS